jgi:hypothetical protein
MRGRIDFVNSFMSYIKLLGSVTSYGHRHAFTTKQSPCGPQDTTDWNVGSSSILEGEW